MKTDILGLIAFPHFITFMGMTFEFGEDIIYWYEIDGWTVVNSFYEPPYLHGLFSILIQLLPLINLSELIKFGGIIKETKDVLEIIPEVSASLEESVQNSPLLQNTQIISDDIFNRLSNFSTLTIEQQTLLFKDLFSSEAFQLTATELYGNFNGYMQMLELFWNSDNKDNYKKALNDVISILIEKYNEHHNIN